MSTPSIAELIIKLTDDASPGAARLSANLQKIVAAEKDIGSQSSAMQKLVGELKRLEGTQARASRFGDVAKGLRQAKTNFDATQSSVKALSRAMSDAETPSRKMAAAYRQAQRDARQAALTFDKQRQAFVDAKSAISGFDGTLGSVIQNEKSLQSAVELATKAIVEQGRAEQRAAELAAESAKKQVEDAKRVAEAERQVHERRRARSEAIKGAVGNVTMLAGPEILTATGDVVKAGAAVQGERVRMTAAGIPDAEIATAYGQATQLSAQYPNVSTAEVLKLYRESRSVLLHPDEVSKMLPAIAQAAAAMNAIDPSGNLRGGLNSAIKGAEIQGIANDPQRFRSYLNSFIKAQQVAGSTLTPEQLYEFSKEAKSSGYALSDRFRMTTAASMIQELGGGTTGVALDQFVKQTQGGFNGPGGHTAAKEFVKLGLANADQFETTANGDIKGMKAGQHLDDYRLAGSDPDQYVYKNIVPALEKNGYLTKEDQVAEVRRLYPNKNAADFVSKLITQRESFANHAKLYGEAQGLDAVDTNKSDPSVGLQSLTGALENFGAALSSPIMKDAAGIMSSMAGGIAGWGKSLADFNEAHPELAKVIAGGAITAGAVGGGVATYSLLSGFMGGFGLSASATALDTSAGLLSDAALALGAEGGVPRILPKGAQPPGGGNPIDFLNMIPGWQYIIAKYVDEHVTGPLMDWLPHQTKTRGGATYDPEAEYNVPMWERLKRMWGGYGGAPGTQGDHAIPRSKPKPSDETSPFLTKNKGDYRFTEAFAHHNEQVIADRTSDPEGSRGREMMRHNVAAAQEAGAQMKDALSVTATPTVDTSSFAAALQMIREIESGIARINGNSIKPAGGGQAVRAVHADVGIGSGAH